MNKNEIKEKLNNIPKDKYIYQRYKGIITKYIQREGYYIDCKTGISTNSEEKAFLGKISKNLIDLIEVGDIVNKELVIDIIDITNDKEEIIGRKLITQYKSAQFTGLDIKHYIYANDIKTILTKESYMANCYKVGGEYE